MKTQLELTLGSVHIEGDPNSDNLAIALCTYFSDHQNRPKDDEDTERGWGEWVEEKVNLAIERIATAAMHALKSNASPDASIIRQCLQALTSAVMQAVPIGESPPYLFKAVNDADNALKEAFYYASPDALRTDDDPLKPESAEEQCPSKRIMTLEVGDKSDTQTYNCYKPKGHPGRCEFKMDPPLSVGFEQ